MRVQSLEVEASDEPERRSPIRRVSTARTKLAGSETGAPIQRFMGREQVRKEHADLHEPGSGGVPAGVLPVRVSPAGRQRSQNRLAVRFMAPMRVQPLEVEAPMNALKHRSDRVSCRADSDGSQRSKVTTP